MGRILSIAMHEAIVYNNFPMFMFLRVHNFNINKRDLEYKIWITTMQQLEVDIFCRLSAE